MMFLLSQISQSEREPIPIISLFYCCLIGISLINVVTLSKSSNELQNLPTSSKIQQVKRQHGGRALMSRELGLNPGAITYQLCDHGYITSPLSSLLLRKKDVVPPHPVKDNNTKSTYA